MGATGPFFNTDELGTPDSPLPEPDPSCLEPSARASGSGVPIWALPSDWGGSPRTVGGLLDCEEHCANAGQHHKHPAAEATGSAECLGDAESCYLAHSLVKFYLNTVFKNYYSKVAKFKDSKSFSTLANNFIVIMSKLQPNQKEDAMLPISESAQRRFLLFRRAFKQLDIEVALVKAFGEVDILLTWMQKFYRL
ncbi:Interleukin family protein [Apodemus speciosus]|uniref:Interleukin family protein n=1 Tax=Apodemus speciosus TaxID=105296 RepID=A0ABQ0EE21_APOSI